MCLDKIVTVNGQEMLAYIDGGTRWSLIALSVAERMVGVQTVEPPAKAKGFAGEPVSCSEKVAVKITVDGQQYAGDCHVVEDAYLEPNKLLLGTGMLCVVGRFILIGNNTVTMLPSLAESAEENRYHVDELLKRYAHCFAEMLGEIGKANT